MPVGIDTGSPVRQRPLMAGWTAAELELERAHGLAGSTGYWRTTRAASPYEPRNTYTSELLAARRCGGGGARLLLPGDC